jgi:hypothetical protein
MPLHESASITSLIWKDEVQVEGLTDQRVHSTIREQPYLRLIFSNQQAFFSGTVT